MAEEDPDEEDDFPTPCDPTKPVKYSITKFVVCAIAASALGTGFGMVMYDMGLGTAVESLVPEIITATATIVVLDHVSGENPYIDD